MLTESPSGAPAIYAVKLRYDWGTVPIGTSEAVIPFVPPDGWAAQLTTLGPFPVGSFGLSVWAGSGGYAQAFNGTGSPLLVGVIEYLVILTNIREAAP